MMSANLLGLGSDLKIKSFFFYIYWMFLNQFGDFIDRDPDWIRIHITALYTPAQG